MHKFCSYILFTLLKHIKKKNLKKNWIFMFFRYLQKKNFTISTPEQTFIDKTINNGKTNTPSLK